MAHVSRNAPCPCGSGRKYKLCCLQAESEEVAPSAALEEVETIDADGDGCRWRLLRRVGPEGTARGELVEHLCTGDRLEVQSGDGWLGNGRPIPMLLAIDELPPQLYDWALGQSLDAVSGEGPTPFGLEVARVVLFASAILDLAGDLAASRRKGALSRVFSRRGRRAA